MSRSPPALPFMAVVFLVAAGLAAPLLPSAAAAPYGSHVFQSNAIIVANAQSYPVYSGSTVAQSFSVNQTYYLANVTLRVLNHGNKFNALNVSIHPDNSFTHVPLMSTTLASFAEVTPTNATGAADYSWPFSPAPLLQAGQTYWIVAQNGAPQASQGYEWYSTNGTTYAGGQALLGSPFWAGLPVDMYFINYGQEYDANVTPAMTVSPSRAQPAQSVTFTVYFNNTGASAAPQVWLNDTLPVALVNVSLSFPGIQPVSAAAFPNLAFADVPNGPNSFRITGQVAIGTSPGTLVTNLVSLAYEDAANDSVQAGTASASVLVGLVTKQAYLGGTSSTALTLATPKPTAATATTITINPGSAPVSFSLAPALAEPLHARNATATLWLKSQKVPPQTYRLNLSLQDNATAVAWLTPSFQITTSSARSYPFVIPLTDYTFGRGHKVKLTITNLGGGSGSTDALIVSYNGTPDPSRLDIGTDTYVDIQNFTLGNQAGPTASWSSLDSLVVQANVSDPFGSRAIDGAWINITSPSGQIVASGAMALTLADAGSLPAWKQFAYTLSPPLVTGHYRVVVNALEDNGVTTLAQGFADVATPVFSFTMTASRTRPETGQTVAFFLWYNNTGTGPAGWAWINDTLPAGLSFQTSSLAPSSVSGSTYTWALTNVGPGAYVLEIDALVTGSSVDWVRNQATFDLKDGSGHTLPQLATGVDLFLNGPILSLDVTSVPVSAVHSNQTVTYTLSLANTGAEASRVWVNLTLPRGLAYQGSSSDLYGSTPTVSGQVVQFNFSGLPANTTWRFNVTALADAGLVRGAAYQANFSLSYASLGGFLMPSEVASLSLIAASPWIPSGSIGFPVNQVLPGENASAIVSFDNLGNEAGSQAWVNLFLDPRLVLTNASASFSGGSGSVAFHLSDVPLGPNRIYLNLSVSPTAADRGSLSILGTLQAWDGYGNALPSVALSEGSVFVTAAQLSLFATPAHPQLEAGAPFPLGISVYNWGTSSAANAWLNLTMPAGLTYLNDTSPAPPAISGNAYTWHWANLTPGPFSIRICLEPRTTLTNGTAVNLAFQLDYEDSDLRSRPPISETVSATIVAPSIVLSVDPVPANAIPGDIFSYTLRMRNAGLTTAETVYLVDEVDPRLQVITYGSSIQAAVENQTYNWTFTGLAPGSTEVVNLTVRVAGGVPAGSVVPNVFEATYTNSLGTTLGHVRSAPLTVSVGVDYVPYALAALGVAATASAAFLVLRRRKVEIEEAFLVYRDGVLISHLSRSLLREKDEDVLSGMLTAVQEFVREAFQYGEHRDLQQLDFGDYRILIERGKYVFLAIVYSGRESIAIHKKVRTVIARIEKEYGAALENWDGDMEEVVGARDLIRDTLLGAGNHNLTSKVLETK